jgi:N-acetylneuraminic acid mutarotase
MSRSSLLSISVILFVLAGAISSQMARAEGWLRKSSMNTARADAAAAAINHIIYVAGGSGIAGPKNAFEAYDTKADHWWPLPALPYGLQQFGMTQAGGRIYLSGGFGGEEESAGRMLWEYQPDRALWRRLTDMPSARVGHSMLALGSKLYVVGGEGPNPAAVFVYNIFDDKWSTATSLPTPRALLSTVLVGGKIYAIGGRRNGVGDVATVEIFDVENDRWTAGPSLPQGRARAASAYIDGQIHLAGGEAQNGARTYSDHFIFTLKDNSWRAGTRMVTPRHSLASAVVDEKWYVMGGSNGANVFTVFTATDLVEVYDADK